jgi:hypothetical protein
MLRKACLTSQEKIMGGEEYFMDQLKSAYSQYYAIKGNTDGLQNDFLHSLAEAQAEAGNLSKKRVYRNLIHREKQRQMAKCIKFLQGKTLAGSTNMVQVRGENSTWKDVNDKREMEEAIMASTQRKYSASFHTLFMQPPLVGTFGYVGLGRAADEVLDGHFAIPEGVDEHTARLIHHLKRLVAITHEGLHPTKLPVHAYKEFWRKAKERTSCYPGVLSFSTLKASSQDDLLCELDCILTRFPLFSGYTPMQWKKCLDVMILKKAGLHQVHSLRTIVLFQPDCNYAFKFVGREMMAHAEKCKTLALEQFGSRKGHRAIDQATNKALTNDILRQTKLPGGICVNDAKSCYDLIVHTTAAIPMRRQGVPEGVILCLFNTLQEAQNHVCTAFGDSTSYFGGVSVIPLHGIYQGNGAGPAIWAVVSTPILDMLRSASLGCHFQTLLSNKVIKYCGFTFVDDSDIIQTAASPREHWTSIVEGLQGSMDMWQGGLKATGGAIVPENNSWNLSAFKWSKGDWKYCSTQDTLASLQVQDIARVVHQLCHTDYNEAIRSLGVDLAPDGNMRQQTIALLKASSLWATQMKAENLPKTDVWTALMSSLWRTLSYPLPVTTLSVDECKAIMAPALNQGLVGMGFCRHFPRALVHSPARYMGLNIHHLHSSQENQRLKGIIEHTAISDFTGLLYRASLEHLLIELGMGEDSLEMPHCQL